MVCNRMVDSLAIQWMRLLFAFYFKFLQIQTPLDGDGDYKKAINAIVTPADRAALKKPIDKGDPKDTDAKDAKDNNLKDKDGKDIKAPAETKGIRSKSSCSLM